MVESSLWEDLMNSWIGHLIVILLGYATIFVPGYLLIKYFRDSKFIERAGKC